MGKLYFIDLFSGAGGLSEGFIREGFTPVAHVEMNKEACDTLRTRLAFHYLAERGQNAVYNAYLQNSISRATLWEHVPPTLMQSVMHDEISSRTIDRLFAQTDLQLGGHRVSVLIGGPPCQAYSLVGRSRDPKGMKGDKRNFLFRYYARFLEYYRPEFFVFENVLGLLSAGSSRYLNEMLALFASVGYAASYKIFHAEDYGVLQKRRRVIITGRRGKAPFVLPEPQKAAYEGGVKKDLLSDLPYLRPGQEMHIAPYSSPAGDYLLHSGIRNGNTFVTQHITRQHNERDLEIYAIAIDKWLNAQQRLRYTELPQRLQTHNNTETFLDRYKVIDPALSHTVVAHIAKDGHYYIYPDSGQVRSLSVREAARLQSFPDDYFFEGGRTAAFKQIGNAVPPLMAAAIAKTIKNLL